MVCHGLQPGTPSISYKLITTPPFYGVRKYDRDAHEGVKSEMKFASLGSSALPRGSTVGRSSYGILTPMRFST
jgi:hypothetical protein